MVDLVTTIERHDRVGLDTSIFIYSIEAAVPFSSLTDRVLAAIATGQVAGVTAIVTIAELLVKPLQAKRFRLAHQYESYLRAFPNLTIADIEVDAARRAALLRADHPLRSADALHLAACLVNDATAFVTNDIRIRQVSAIDVIVLSDFVGPGTIGLTTP